MGNTGSTVTNAVKEEEEVKEKAVKEEKEKQGKANEKKLEEANEVTADFKPADLKGDEVDTADADLKKEEKKEAETGPALASMPELDVSSIAKALKTLILTTMAITDSVVTTIRYDLPRFLKNKFSSEKAESGVEESKKAAPELVAAIKPAAVSTSPEASVKDKVTEQGKKLEQETKTPASVTKSDGKKSAVSDTMPQYKDSLAIQPNAPGSAMTEKKEKKEKKEKTEIKKKDAPKQSSHS